ncbi:TonB-dependent receptor [Flavobacterium quisquiliarum]|uniref:TonB-dependent siderophore receptor n=1 Tax=Flavobacterium quisquiliarum TaxID=1834436 RepID=A0ABV8VYQ9_9FLAO|nr:TonB-dependent receptor [Flavobacterium quisquiliarum]MBW1655759.1 TonB-dependent siderophore receptor [Flavobacterium quisquiliarum]NWL01494.1 TonB-dependent siderophore receptor [Flavobacterium collinsii]
MKIVFNKKVYFFALLLTSLNMMAQEFGKVTGKVTLIGNKPAENIAVALKGTKYSDVTTVSGQYEITRVKPGTYTIVISGVGIQALEDKIVVISQKTTSKNFSLSETQEDLDEVVITKNKYKQDKPSLSLRLQTPVLEIPQNIQIVSSQTLKDQQITSMSDGVIRNVSGAVRLEHWGDLYTNITMRGSQIQAFRNGFNVVSSFWGPLTEDMSFVDHIEFVKGPAGFMLSSGDPSGLYNVVTKKPTGITKGEVSAIVGSYDFYRVSLDLDGKLDKKGKLLYRFNGAAQKKGSFRPYEHNDRYVIAPVISYQFDDKTKLTFEYNFQYANMTEVGSYYVFGPKAGGYATMPRNFTMTAPGLPDTNIQDHSGYLQFEHKFDDNWKLTAQTSYFKYIQQGYSSWPSAVGPATTANGDIANGEIIRNVGIWDADSNMFLGQIFVNGKFSTGAVSHKVLGGIDLGDKDYAADWGQSHDLDTAANPFNIYNPNYGTPSNGFPQFDHDTPLSQRAGGLYGTKYAAGYIQDELGFFSNRLRLTLAARYTWISQTSSYETEPNEDSHITPRAGLSYSITNDLAVYGLYDQAFTPQSGVVRDGELKPLTGNNVEFGIKKDWFDGSWNTTLSVYNIIKKNELTSDPLSTPQNPTKIVLGEKRAQGFEFDLRGKIFDGLNLIANYAFTESTVTKSNVSGINVGDVVPGYSKHTANAWLNYTVQSGKIKGLGASIGGTFLDGRETDTWGEGLQRLPSYFKLDGGVSYEIGKVKVTANVFNILDKYLYSGSYYEWLQAYYWQAEAGRNFRVGVTYKF